MSEAYEAGRRFFNEHRSRIKHMPFGKINPYWPRDEKNWVECDEYERGLKEAEQDFIQNTLGAAKFLDALQALCKEYGVRLSMGCGCCGGGGFVKDETGYEWEFMF